MGFRSQREWNTSVSFRNWARYFFLIIIRQIKIPHRCISVAILLPLFSLTHQLAPPECSCCAKLYCMEIPGCATDATSQTGSSRAAFMKHWGAELISSVSAAKLEPIFWSQLSTGIFATANSVASPLNTPRIFPSFLRAMQIRDCWPTVDLSSCYEFIPCNASFFLKHDIWSVLIHLLRNSRSRKKKSPLWQNISFPKQPRSRRRRCYRIVRYVSNIQPSTNYIKNQL